MLFAGEAKLLPGASLSTSVHLALHRVGKDVQGNQTKRDSHLDSEGATPHPADYGGTVRFLSVSPQTQAMP